MSEVAFSMHAEAHFTGNTNQTLLGTIMRTNDWFENLSIPYPRIMRSASTELLVDILRTDGVAIDMRWIFNAFCC